MDLKKGTPTEWSLKRVLAMKSTFGQFYTRSAQVAEAALAIPVSNAWSVRGTSQLKLIRTRIKSQIKNDLYASPLHISINVPVPHTGTCDSLVSEAVCKWKAAKKRRKLEHQRPSTQPQANSETELPTLTTAVQDIGTRDMSRNAHNNKNGKNGKISPTITWRPMQMRRQEGLLVKPANLTNLAKMANWSKLPTTTWRPMQMRRQESPLGKPANLANLAKMASGPL